MNNIQLVQLSLGAVNKAECNTMQILLDTAQTQYMSSFTS